MNMAEQFIFQRLGYTNTAYQISGENLSQQTCTITSNFAIFRQKSNFKVLVQTGFDEF